MQFKRVAKLIKVGMFYNILPEMCGVKYHLGTTKLSKQEISMISHYSGNLNKE